MYYFQYLRFGFTRYLHLYFCMFQLLVDCHLREMGTLGSLYALFLKEKQRVDSCLLPCTPIP